MTTTDLDLSGFYADSVESGLTVTQDTLLDGIVAAGVAYINQAKVDVSSDTNAFTASQDTYVDVGDDAVITYSAVANGAGAPVLAADAVRLAKVVTDGTTITDIVDMRTLTDLNKFVFGLVDIGVETAMELYNGGGATVMVRFGVGSTSGGMPLNVGESRDVTELVYVKPKTGNGLLLVTK